MRLFSIFFTLFVLILSSGEAGAVTPAAGVPPHLEVLWDTGGFYNPESVVYDSVKNVLYVSNAWGNVGFKDGKGLISKVGLDGNIIQKDWVSGLNAPKGLGLYKNFLYVADIDELVKINIKLGKVVARFKAPNAKFLNDVVVSQAGKVFVSDTATNEIYTPSGKALKVWLKDDKLENPNGLYISGKNLIVASWGVMTDGFKTKVPGHLKKVSLSKKKVESLGNGTPIGNLDGLEWYSFNSYFATDWMIGKLLFIDSATGKTTLLKKLVPGSADLTYIPSRNLLIIPLMNTHHLVAYKVN